MKTALGRKVLLALCVIAVVFGLMSIMSGGAILFGAVEAQRAAGAYVGFVLWFNFIGGFVYVAAGGGLLARRRWAVVLAWLLALATLLMFAAFGLHAAGGANFEMRTVWAMSSRLALWLAIAWMAWRWIWRAR